MGHFGVDCVCMLLVITTANVAWWLTVCQARWELWGSARMLHLCGLGSPPASCFRGRDTEAQGLKSMVLHLSLLSFIYRIILESELWFSKHDWMWAPRWKKPAAFPGPQANSLEGNICSTEQTAAKCVLCFPSHNPPDSVLWLRVLFVWRGSCYSFPAKVRPQWQKALSAAPRWLHDAVTATQWVRTLAGTLLGTS